MATLEDLRQRILSQVLGFAREQQQMGELSADMSSSATTFSLDANSANNIGRGLAEIGDELVLVREVDLTTNVGTVMGGVNGRGQSGSTAAAHSTGDLVTMSPLIPRVRVTEAINEVTRAMYPELPVFDVTEIGKLAPVFEYEMPADTEGIWYVVDDTVGPTQVHYPAPRWRYNPMAPTSDFPSGKSIQLLDFVTPGRAMRVVYTKQPTLLSAGTDEFTVTGYEDRISDIVVWGACARLLPSYEAARLQQTAVEGTERANLVPSTSAVKTAAYYESMYQQALARERNRIMEEIPNYAFWQGG